MNKAKNSTGSVRFVWSSALAVALTGCTTYVERPAHTVYVPPPPVVVTPAPSPIVVVPAEPPVVVVQTESDFYEPLSPHGEWVVVESYGRCWRPTRVAVGWRPYTDGHWRRTDDGWYWVSDEPWGWATYHYGRWDFSARFGWVWVPQTQWAPAWVSWRQGAGYVGWAPLPPSARIGTRGIVEVQDRAFAPHAFVFVSEQRLLEPVRSTTVIVNNTTVVNQTVNITKIQVSNRRVINEGPRPDVIERKSGKKIEAVAVHELRRREEREVANRRGNAPPTAGNSAPSPARTEPAPSRVIPPRESRVEQPAAVTQPPQTPATRNEVRKPAPPTARPEVERPVRNERPQEQKNGKAAPEIVRPDTAPKGRPEAKPQVLPRETRSTEKPSDVRKQPQLPVRKNEVIGTGEVRPSGKPAPTEVKKPLGNERQRELQRVKTPPEKEQPAAVKKAPQLPTGKQVQKPKLPVKKQQPASKQDEAKKKKDDKKKGEEQETSPARPQPPQ